MRAFLFDLDGTLVDTERENAASIERVLAARGRLLDEAERTFVIGHGWREIYQRLVAGGGVDLEFEALVAASAIEKEAIVDDAGLRALPGSGAFVRAAAAHGPCVVVSGSSRREIAFCLSRLDLLDVIPWYIGAEDVRAGKPSPEGYLLAARRLAVPVADCVVFEDSTAGIRAARSAGMYCVALGAANHGGQDQSAAHERVSSYLDLDERLFRGHE